MKRTEVVSEVTGTVWKIEVAVGTKVAAEDTVMILESMKMEIPVPAPCTGTMAEIYFKEGDKVSEGEVVAIIE